MSHGPGVLVARSPWLDVLSEARLVAGSFAGRMDDCHLGNGEVRTQ